MNLGNQPIFLIGYRGTGKTTVARVLAELWSWECIDADEEIERRAGKSIAAIFAEEGESMFRSLETAVVAELACRKRAVVALGGGAVLSEANRTAIRRGGIVIWLTATPETIAKRLATDVRTATQRPNLTTTGGFSEIKDLLAFREPIYRECATFVVDTENKKPAEIVDEIVAQLASMS